MNENWTKINNNYDQVAVLARLVSQLVAATCHPATVAAVPASAPTARHDAFVEQSSVQVLVPAASQKPPAAAVASSVHAPGRVPDAGEQARWWRIPVPAVVRTVAPDQLVTRPVAPDPRFFS